MRHVAVHCSVALPEETDLTYAPDGLDEQDIDALMAESGISVDADVDNDSTAERAPTALPLRTREPAAPTKSNGGEAA